MRSFQQYVGGPEVEGLVWLPSSGVVAVGIPGEHRAICPAESSQPPPPPTNCPATANFTSVFQRVELGGRTYFLTRDVFPTWEAASSFCTQCIGPLEDVGFAQITSTNRTAIPASRVRLRTRFKHSQVLSSHRRSMWEASLAALKRLA